MFCRDECRRCEEISPQFYPVVSGGFGIIHPMKKSLLETNPYLWDASTWTKALARNIETSSAIEGIREKRDAYTGRFVA